MEHYARWQTAIAMRVAERAARIGVPVTFARNLEFALCKALGQPMSLSKWSRMTFNDKVTYRKLRVRDAALKECCDKRSARELVSEKLGSDALPMLIRESSHVDDFSDLFGPFVLKPNHGSGWIIFVLEERRLTSQELAMARKWMKIDYGNASLEWGHSGLERYLIAEELLAYPPPCDYKLFVFEGIPRVIQVDEDRFGSHVRVLMTPEWQVLGGLKYPMPLTPPERPQNLEGLLSAASKLGDGFDFLRVDLYSLHDRLVVGELSCYPGSGKEKFAPASLDRMLGGYWSRRPN